MNNLRAICQEYCAWDDTWNYLDGKNPKYIENNLTHEYLKRSDLDLIIFLRADGTIAWSHAMKAGKILDVSPDEHTLELEKLATLTHTSLSIENAPQDRKVADEVARTKKATGLRGAGHGSEKLLALRISTAAPRCSSAVSVAMFTNRNPREAIRQPSSAEFV